jgi:thiamine kinase-like enzyme
MTFASAVTMPPAALVRDNTNEHLCESFVPTPYLNDASKVLPFHVDCASPDRDDHLVHVATTLCPSLLKHKEDSPELSSTDKGSTALFTISKLTGGLSNVLFVVRSPQGASCLVRIHSLDSIIAERDDENRILAWLSKRDMAPTFYGRFMNGRVEQFYQGYVPLAFYEMHAHHKQVASLLSSLHSSTVPESVLPPTSTAQCWTNIATWLKLAKQQQQQQQQQPPSPQQQQRGGLIHLDYLERESHWLQRKLDVPQGSNKVITWCRQLVFTHMDCQSLNILRNSSNSDIKLIDYEYAGWNPRVLDLANTFLEYCNMNNLIANWETEYPSDQQQDEFLRAYCASSAIQHQFILNSLDTVRNEIGTHTLISHLHWTIWSLLQHDMSDIDFDYIQYAQQRMEGYECMKKKYFFKEIMKEE